MLTKGNLIMKNKNLLILSSSFILIMMISASSTIGYSINYNRNDISTNAEQNSIGNLQAPDWYHKPANYATLVQWYQTLEDSYPQYLEVFKANELYDTGTATGGYDLYYVRITNEALGLHKPEVLFLGGPHGDETVGTVGMYWFTDWLMRMVFTDETSSEYSDEYLEWILDNREIYFEISHNPYGFDHGPQRYDGNSWDLNREADFDGPGYPTGGVWASVNGKTLRAFIDNHVIRLALDFHGGARMLLYPWGSTHSNILGTSPISGYTYDYAPPDFYYFDASSLRLGNYMGDYGGNLDKYSIGTIPGTVGYVVQGGIAPWAYAADVLKNPVEDPYVKDETWGNYPGAGVLWISPEMSDIKNPSESEFGNDTVHRYGAEVRRVILHQADLAQPYLLWQTGTVESNSEVEIGTSVPFIWQVNGSLVVDHTYVQWSTDPDPIANPEHTTDDYDEHTGDYYGGTGWDNANNGATNGVNYNENIFMDKPGDYYFVAKAQVDQVYADVLRPDVYGDNPYLRLIKERVSDSYYEELDGTDGLEIITGQDWWYSPIIHVKVLGEPPNKPEKLSGSEKGNIGTEYTYYTNTTDPDGDNVFYWFDWGDGNISAWIGPFNSSETASANHTWNKKGTYLIKVRAKDTSGQISPWSDTLSISMPRNKASINSFLLRLLQKIADYFTYLKNIFKL
jgi:hypothetical protein